MNHARFKPFVALAARSRGGSQYESSVHSSWRRPTRSRATHSFAPCGVQPSVSRVGRPQGTAFVRSLQRPVLRWTVEPGHELPANSWRRRPRAGATSPWRSPRNTTADCPKLARRTRGLAISHSGRGTSTDVKRLRQVSHERGRRAAPSMSMPEPHFRLTPRSGGCLVCELLVADQVEREPRRAEPDPRPDDDQRTVGARARGRARDVRDVHRRVPTPHVDGGGQRG